MMYNNSVFAIVLAHFIADIAFLSGNRPIFPGFLCLDRDEHHRDLFMVKLPKKTYRISRNPGNEVLKRRIDHVCRKIGKTG